MLHEYGFSTSMVIIILGHSAHYINIRSMVFLLELIW